MSQVIGIEYTLKDANSKEQLDTNVGGAPLEFIVGKGQIIPGLESKVIEMKLNEEADILVNPAEAYGEINEEAIQTLPREQFAGIEIAEGMSLYGTGEQGETVQVMVKSFSEEEVIIDYNHPMAGKTLLFSVSVLSTRAATEEEIQTGVVGGAAAMSGGGCCGGGGQSQGSCGTEEPKQQQGGCGC